MKSYTGATDAISTVKVEGEIRAFFSATAVRLKEQVWLCVETRWIGDGTPVTVTLFRESEDGATEPLETFDGTISSGLWEKQWTVELPEDVLDEVHGAIVFYFDVAVEAQPALARSQTLLLHRTRFSS